MIAAGFLFGCASGPSLITGETETPLMYGQGSGESAVVALQSAKLNIIQKAAERILGTAAASANRDELAALFGMDFETNMFIIRDSVELISRGSEAASFFASLKARVDLSALASFLRSNNILGGQVLPQGTTPVLEDEQTPLWARQSSSGTVEQSQTLPSEEKAAVSEAVEEVVEETSLTEEEKARVREYMENLSFLVYFDPETETDPFLMKAAVSSANKFLGNSGYRFRDLDQVERIRTDQELAYEEETGKSISIIQWIAAKLKADVYIEVAASVSSSTENSRHYGSAAVTLNIFDSATGNGLGQAYYQTNPPAFSTVSQSDALNNAMASAVYKAMPEGIRLAETGFAKAVSQGFTYELIFINTPNSRLMREFVDKMKRRTKDIERTSYSRDETRYTVKYIGSVEELEFLVYDMAELVPGLESMTMVMQRGSSITFETGM